VTRHGIAVRISSTDDEVSAACFAEDTFLLLVLISPLETIPPVDFETLERGLTVAKPLYISYLDKA
jgi:hypothetical protein